MAEPQGLMIEPDRYLRQEMIWGKKGQALLNQARVSVIGLGYQGVYTALCFAALGIGNIVLVDGNHPQPDESFLGELVEAEWRVHWYRDMLSKINPQLNIEAYPYNLDSRGADQTMMQASTAIVEATNSPDSKALAHQYARRHSIPLLSTSSRWGYTKLQYCESSSDGTSYRMPMFEAQPQDIFMALLMCGVTTEEVKKIILGEKDALLTQPVRYRLGPGYRYGYQKEAEQIPTPDPEIYQALNVEMRGAGGIGCWAAIIGAHMGLGRFDPTDYDTFGPTNANRQALSWDGIGLHKAPHVAEKIRRMSRGRTSSTGNNVKITPEYTMPNGINLILDFVDNPYTRALNTLDALAHNVPMISAGSEPFGGRTVTQVPGLTQCLDCVYKIVDRGRQDEMIRRASCAANPDPSVVMSNAVAAAMAMLEIYSIYEPEKFGLPFSGERLFRSTLPFRFGANSLTYDCSCYNKPLPDLTITDYDVEQFVIQNPELLRGRD